MRWRRLRRVRTRRGRFLTRSPFRHGCRRTGRTGPGQGDKAALDLGVDRGRDEAVEQQCLQHVSAQVGVGAPLGGQEPDVQLVAQAGAPVPPPRGVLRFSPLPDAAHRTREGDRASCCRHGDVRAVDLGVPQQLCGHVGLHQVVRHCLPPRVGTAVWRGGRLSPHATSTGGWSNRGNPRAAPRCADPRLLPPQAPDGTVVQPVQGGGQ